MKLRGSVTVFVSMIMTVLTAFSGVVVDLSRFRAGESLARAAVQLSVQSALTQYFAPLKDNYGLWASGCNEEELEILINDLLEKNLCVENAFMPGITDLFHFSVENVAVYSMFNLADENILEKEITQFMKYRAPVNTIGLFLEKLKAVNMFMAQSGLLKKRMELEDELQKVREKQVYLNLLLSERIRVYQDNGKPVKEIRDRLVSISSLLGEINRTEEKDGELDKSYRAMPLLIGKIKESRDRINDIEREISVLEGELSSLERDFRQIENKIDTYNEEITDIEREISKIEEKILKEEKKDAPDESILRSYYEEIAKLNGNISGIERDIKSLDYELEKIYDDIQDTEKKITAGKEKIKTIEESVKSEKNELKSRIEKCIEVLGNIQDKTEIIKENMMEIKDTLSLYINYHEEAVKIISEILTQSEKISLLTEKTESDIKKQSEKSDNAFLVKIKADMKKLSLTVNAEVLNSIKTGLEENLDLLNKAVNVTDYSARQAEEVINNILLFINRTEQVYESLNFMEREVFGLQLEHHVNEVNEKINVSVSGYRVNSYDLEPSVNQKEKNEFYRWCNRVFNEKNETGGKDKGHEKKLKDNIKKADDKGKEENEKSFDGKDGKLSEKELEQLFNSLPSNKNDETGLLPFYEDINEETEEQYKKQLDNNSDIASGIESILSGIGENLLKSLYINEYIICAFKNANIDKVPTQRINLYGGPAKTFFDKAEVEYILFGKKKEKANANLAQASIFGVRMGLNLLHVYMSTDKTAAALTAAVYISGWTGFGVPLVKNLILFGWAAGESYLDLKDINEGKDVPVYKTDNTWRLSLKSIFSGIAGQFLDESSNMLTQTKEELIDKADDAVSTLIKDMVSAAVHEAFLPLQQAIDDFGNEDDSVEDLELIDFGNLGEISNIDDLKAWVQEYCRKQYQAVMSKASGWTKTKLEDYKSKITDKITGFIIDSQAYKKLFSSIRRSLDNIIDAGANSISDSLEQIGNRIGDEGLQNQLVGTVVSFDYTDYLRLLLLAVPGKTKLLRTADLIQLNMMETLDNPDFDLSEYNSFLIVEADISMSAMFIPSFFKKTEPGRFKIRWGYGY